MSETTTTPPAKALAYWAYEPATEGAVLDLLPLVIEGLDARLSRRAWADPGLCVPMTLVTLFCASSGLDAAHVIDQLVASTRWRREGESLVAAHLEAKRARSTASYAQKVDAGHRSALLQAQRREERARKSKRDKALNDRSPAVDRPSNARRTNKNKISSREISSRSLVEETPSSTAAAALQGAAAADGAPAAPVLRVVAPTIAERVAAVLARCTGAILAPADREAVAKRLERGLRVLCRAAVRRTVVGAEERSMIRPTLVVLVASERALAAHGADALSVLLAMAPAIATSGPVTARRLAELARNASERLQEASLTERRGVTQGLDWALEHVAGHVCAAAAIERPIRRAS